MSRIYNSCLEMLSEEFRNLMELGTEVQSSTMQDKDVRNNEDYKTKELIGNTFTILDTSDAEEMFETMKKEYNVNLSISWADAEFEERISDLTSNPGEAYKLREEVWSEFLHNGRFSYTYNERISPYRFKILEQLKQNPGSRQAIISIFNPVLDIPNMGGKARIPCSMFYQFLIREIAGKKRLNMIYVMRSSDLLTHFVNDIYLAIKMQRYFTEQIGLEIGNFTMFISSFHAYYKDLKRYNIF